MTADAPKSNRSNDSWRGNGPIRGTTFTTYSLEDVEFLRANTHLTARQAAEALSVKYGRKISPPNIKWLAENHGITMAKGKRGRQSNLASTPHDTFYVSPEFLAKAYVLPPVLEEKYKKEETQTPSGLKEG